MSEGPPTRLPSRCSGDIYASEPTVTPKVVRSSAPRSRAMPKSNDYGTIVVVTDQDVGGLEIPMDDSKPVDVVNRARYVPQHRNGRDTGQPPVSPQGVA